MVPPTSHGVSRVPRYSGYGWLSRLFVYGALTLYDAPSHALQLKLNIPSAVQTPRPLLASVWPLPRSLATTDGISVDVFSSPYLDVSVQAVPLLYLWIQYRIPCGGFPHSDIHGSNACSRLTVAFRRSLRPSSALSAKASPLRSF